jgi:superfamily I DNA/RNA helicase
MNLPTSTHPPLKAKELCKKLKSLIVSNKPAKLNDHGNIYTKNTQKQRKRLNYYLSNCLKKGVQAGEFKKMPVKEITSILMMMVMPSPDDVKLDNLNQLQFAAARYTDIESFLRYTDTFQDESVSDNKEGVNLMTIHKAILG